MNELHEASENLVNLQYPKDFSDGGQRVGSLIRSGPLFIEDEPNYRRFTGKSYVIDVSDPSTSDPKTVLDLTFSIPDLRAIDKVQILLPFVSQSSEAQSYANFLDPTKPDGLEIGRMKIPKLDLKELTDIPSGTSNVSSSESLDIISTSQKLPVLRIPDGVNPLSLLPYMRLSYRFILSDGRLYYPLEYILVQKEWKKILLVYLKLLGLDHLKIDIYDLIYFFEYLHFSWLSFAHHPRVISYISSLSLEQLANEITSNIKQISKKEVLNSGYPFVLFTVLTRMSPSLAMCRSQPSDELRNIYNHKVRELSPLQFYRMLRYTQPNQIFCQRVMNIENSLPLLPYLIAFPDEEHLEKVDGLAFRMGMAFPSINGIFDSVLKANHFLEHITDYLAILLRPSGIIPLGRLTKVDAIYTIRFLDEKDKIMDEKISGSERMAKLENLRASDIPIAFEEFFYGKKSDVPNQAIIIMLRVVARLRRNINSDIHDLISLFFRVVGKNFLQILIMIINCYTDHEMLRFLHNPKKPSAKIIWETNVDLTRLSLAKLLNRFIWVAAERKWIDLSIKDYKISSEGYAASKVRSSSPTEFKIVRSPATSPSLLEEPKPIIKNKIAEALEDVRECCICYENVSEEGVLACGHSLCKECTEKQVGHGGKCPLCRKGMAGGYMTDKSNLDLKENERRNVKSKELSNNLAARFINAGMDNGSAYDRATSTDVMSALTSGVNPTDLFTAIMSEYNSERNRGINRGDNIGGNVVENFGNNRAARRRLTSRAIGTLLQQGANLSSLHGTFSEDDISNYFTDYPNGLIVI